MTRSLKLASLGTALVILAACKTGSAPEPVSVAEQAPPPASVPAPAAEPPATSTPAPEAAPVAAAPAPAPSPAPRTPPKPAPAPSPAPAPAPAPEPRPAPVVKTVAAGTNLEVEMLDGVSSKASLAGDTFRARVATDVVVDGVTVIPAGAALTGSVVEAQSLRKIGGQAKLVISFDRLDLPSGGSATLNATLAQEGKSETGKDAATIGGSAAAGALLGRVIGKKGDKSKATAIGAIVGAAAGTAVAAKTEGQEIDVPAGTMLSVPLAAPAQITVESR